MLAESSGVAIDIDLDAIEPPAGVALEQWLKTFPSFGFLLSVPQTSLDATLDLFRGRDIHAGVIGEVRSGSEVGLVSNGRRAVLRDFRRDRLLGLSRVVEIAR
jgi:selenophosphate synthetase-related protein